MSGRGQSVSTNVPLVLKRMRDVGRYNDSKEGEGGSHGGKEKTDGTTRNTINGSIKGKRRKK